MKKYEWRKTAIKVIKFMVLVGVPAGLNYFTVNYPQIANLTVSTILWGFYDYLKHKVGVNLY